MTEVFYLYEADTYRWVMIHTATCRHCRQGQGTQPHAQGRTSRWHGPYQTYDAAHAGGLALQDRVYPCQRCVPNEVAPSEAP
jgi:hypothetical protein